jgi:hypothetical protein
LHHPTLREVIDNHIREVDLVGVERSSREEAGERFFGGAAVQADQGADEPAQAL